MFESLNKKMMQAYRNTKMASHNVLLSIASVALANDGGIFSIDKIFASINKTIPSNDSATLIIDCTVSSIDKTIPPTDYTVLSIDFATHSIEYAAYSIDKITKSNHCRI